MGRSVVVVHAPPPQPQVLTGVRVARFTEGAGGVTMYHVDVFAGGQQWEVAARFSAFEALRSGLEGAPPLPPFPGKKPIRSLFGLRDGAKEERRVELERWLGSAVACSASFPWMRRHIHAFCQVPAAVLQQVPAAASAAASNVITVQMPAGVAPGALLEVEVHGRVYNIPAPEGVVAGANFEVELPVEDGGAPDGGGAPLATPAPLTQAAAAPPVQMSVAVPPGAGPGQKLVVQSPSGQQMSVEVPPGLSPGASFIVEFPGAVEATPYHGGVVGAVEATPYHGGGAAAAEATFAPHAPAGWAQQGAVAAAGTATWACAQCTLTNAAGVKACAACGAQQGSSAAAPLAAGSSANPF